MTRPGRHESGERCYTGKRLNDLRERKHGPPAYEGDNGVEMRDARPGGNGGSESRATWPRRFTLIELLVVIAIISILMAMLLPSLSKTRLTAQVVCCLSQLRQHGIALSAYADDHGGMYPEQHPHPFANNPYSFRLSYYETLSGEYGLAAAVWNDVNWASGGFATGAYYDRVPPRYATGYLVLAGGNGYPTWKNGGQPYSGNMRVVGGNWKQFTGSAQPTRVPLVGDYLLDGYYGTWAPHGYSGFFRAAGPSDGAPPSPRVCEVSSRVNQVFEDGHVASTPFAADGVRQYDAGWGYFFWW